MRWTNEEIEFLRRNKNRLDNEQLGRILNRSKIQIINAMRRYGIKRDKLIGKRMRARRIWNEADWAFVVNHFLVMNIRELSQYVPHSEQAIQMRLNKFGLYLPENIKAYRHKKAQFKKGQIPWNKGKKGLRLSPATEFKPGNKPWNTKYDGYISVRDLNRIPYKYIRVESGKWVLYHHWLWEQNLGPVPKGFVVHFKNGNTMDVRLENLELISRAELAMRNRNELKASESLKKIWAEDRFNMSDLFVANALCKGDPDLKKELLKHKDLLELKRLQIKLKRTIREANQ